MANRLYNTFEYDTDASENSIREPQYYIKDHIIVVSSADRDWINRTDENVWNFNVRLGGKGVNNQYSMVQNDMHNVISVGIDKLIMTNRALNITYSNTVADMSTYPYLLVGVENIAGNLNGTNKTIDNAIGIMTHNNGILTKSDSECNFIEFGNTSALAKEFYNQPIAKLSGLNITINNPLGSVPSPIDDVLNIKSITYLPAVASNLATEYLVVQSVDYFHPEQYKVGDIIKFGDYVYRDTGVYAECSDFNTFINRDNGHRVIAVSTSDSTKTLWNRLYIPTPNSASVSTGNVSAETWFDDLKTKSMDDITTASSVTDSGKLLNYSMQTHMVYKVRSKQKMESFLEDLV